MLQSNQLLKTAAFLLTFLHFSPVVFSQGKDSTKHTLNFRGSVSVTNNGFSLVPTFTLGKPALVTILNVSGKKRLSFEPEFRYSLEDFKPWSFIFIWRYKLVRKEKFQFSVGTHLPALNFKTTPVVKNGVEEDVIQARRFFPVIEAIPNYRVSENFTLSMYCQYGRGMEKEVANDIYFISIRPDFSNIRLSKQFYLRLNTQFYYLKIAKNDGIYVAGGLTLAKRGFPLSVSTFMNQVLQTDIAGKNFDWNVSLVYSFDQKYIRQ